MNEINTEQSKMQIENIEIGGKGVKSILRKFKPEEAIAELIWNGFDAHANKVSIDFETNHIGGLTKITITDNGYGIPQETLNQKFKPFFESEKADLDTRHHSLTHGRNGIGRLTFFTFAINATWTTRYTKKDKIFEYDININSTNLENYTGSNSPLRNPTINNTGTSVSLENIRNLNKNDILGRVSNYLEQEFGWFLELFKSRGLTIEIDGKELKYDSIIGERDSTQFIHKETNTTFDISFIRWNQNLQTEYSRFYLINSKNNEIWKDTTKLNNKGDNFYHSVYVKSSLFDDFIYDERQKSEQDTLIGKSKNDPEYKFLEEEITNYLRKKRKPFLREFANQLVETYEKEGIFPEFDDEWDIPRKEELKEVIKGLYFVQPKIFSVSSIEQKKTFIHFLNALLKSDERDQILTIINEIVQLDFEERNELLELLKATKLTSIIRTMKLITDRYLVVDQLKELVFNTNLKANERDHLQKMIDEHYWLFGEQYYLVTSTETRFEKALRKYLYILGRESDSVKINHPSRNKEMDIFLCKWNKQIDTIDNIVVELKSPSINLGKTETDQVIEYMEVIRKQPEFNDKNMSWEFYLVGNKFDTSGWIESLIKSNEPHGKSKKGLIHSGDNYKIYARTWSQIFTDFECRYQFIEEQLKIERTKFSKEYSTADEIISKKPTSQTILERSPNV